MDGFRVMTMAEAAKLGHFFITSTGNTDVITVEHMKSMKNGAVLGNAGHFNVEVMVKELEEAASSKKKVRRDLDEYILDGKKIYLIGEGRLANLVAAEGHPAEVMDMSFANQALAAKYLVDNKGKLEPKVIPLPGEIDISIARTKLQESGIKIDELSERQKEYLAAWGEGAFKSERE
jgi:adenosylhomocysteinase